MSSPAAIQFIKTPAAKPQQPRHLVGDGVYTTDSPTIYNAVLPAELPSNKQFSNYVLIGLITGLPLYLTWRYSQGLIFFLVSSAICFLPALAGYWLVMSRITPRLNDKVPFPNRGVEHYIKFKDPKMAATYKGQNKIPMETFHEMYFEGEVDFNGDALDILEFRADWSTSAFTFSLIKFFLTGMIPEVILHTRSQDEEQVRGHYDRGDDFYAWFLGPRMIYTSGVIGDITREETLEELQDNKLRIVCEKIGLKKGEKMLDLGCGWGTLARFASSQYGAHVTGITLGKNQTAWGNGALAKDGIPETQSKILCMDYRDTPLPATGKYDKITCLEMAEHVGVRHLTNFFKQVNNMLEDDGCFFLQIAGLRKYWQYDDFVWGLFMNKYIFPGADASTPLDFVVACTDAAGFEVVSVDNIGVHYCATIWRWYRNWMGNKEKVIAKYGEKWFRIWEYFLATSTIIARQGSSTVFQIVLRKQLNAYPSILDVPRQYGLDVPKPAAGNNWVS